MWLLVPGGAGRKDGSTTASVQLLMLFHVSAAPGTGWEAGQRCQGPCLGSSDGLVSSLAGDVSIAEAPQLSTATKGCICLGAMLYLVPSDCCLLTTLGGAK